MFALTMAAFDAHAPPRRREGDRDAQIRSDEGVLIEELKAQVG
jgi:hypothetical protein